MKLVKYALIISTWLYAKIPDSLKQPSQYHCNKKTLQNDYCQVNEIYKYPTP